ncbi:MAG: cytidylate kinase-like family protein [Clostridiales bacterium]|nr:cytidylate kinase-like family protein [Clostridiales bacterium]
MGRVICISRELGSGGREVGFHLSQKLNIPVYDKEIISMAAEHGNIAEEFVSAHDEVIAGKDRNETYHYVNPFSPVYEVPMSDQLFYLQSQVIHRLEQEGPCIIIGRCSDIVVSDGFKVFICSSMKKRLERLSRLEPDVPIRQLEANARAIDRKRRDYYSYYSGNEWGNPRNYDLCLNSGKLGVERCVDIIASNWQEEKKR